MLERLPRALLEIGVVVGGLIIPAWCTLAPRWRASRIALFLPSAILVPTAAGQSGRSSISRLRTASCSDVPARPSEIIESYLFFFMLGFLIVFERRIQELEAAEQAAPK